MDPDVELLSEDEFESLLARPVGAGRFSPQEWDRIQAKMAPILWGLVCRIAPHCLREDAYCDMLGMMWEAIDKQPFDSNRGARATTWLGGIARYRLLKWRHREMRHGTRASEFDLNELPARWASHDVELEEQVLLIQTALTEDQQVLLHGWMNGLTSRKIADTLGLTVAAVRSRLYQLRREIREKFDHWD